MNLNLRRHIWIINLVTISLCALFAAGAVGKVVEAKAPRPPGPLISSPPALGPSSVAMTSRDISNILGRNIFCSTCPPLTGELDREPAAGAAGDAAASGAPVKTSLRIKLVATLVSDDREWCFAEIASIDRKKVGLYAIGARITGAGEEVAVISDILAHRVLLLNEGRAEYLDLIPGKEASSPAGAGSAAPEMPKPRSAIAAIAGQIKKVGEGKYEIQRGALQKVLGNPALLARTARIVPAMAGGKPSGFSLYSIRQGSLYSLLGMFNGDTINAVNGHAITTPDQALAVYTRLRSASFVTIAFTRRGKPLTHEYTIR